MLKGGRSMGFLDFLKKKENKTNTKSTSSQQGPGFKKDSANIPPPPSAQETKQNQTNDTTPTDMSNDPFAPNDESQKNNPFGQSEQQSNQKDPFTQEPQTSNDLFAQSTTANQNSNVETTQQPPSSFQENNPSSNNTFGEYSPEEPNSFMERKAEDFGPSQGYDWSHAEPLDEAANNAPMADTTQAPNPEPEQLAKEPEEEKPAVQESSTEEDEDFSLPDLPDLPKEAQEESANAQEEHEEYQKPKPQAPTNKEEEKQTEQPAKEKNLEPTDTSLKEEPSYEKEEPKETIPHEFYVETHEFYDTLQEIKLVKKLAKECDKNTHNWEEVDNKTNKKVDTLLEGVDQVQEDLMKIDAALFER